MTAPTPPPSGIFPSVLNSTPLLRPLLNIPFLDKCLPALVAFISSTRVRFSYPLQRRCPPPLKQYTVGEVLFVFPLAVGCLFSWITYSTSSDCEASGGPAAMFAGAALFCASHNSIVTFLSGIPFERALFYHKILAWAATITGGLHGWQCYQEGDNRRRLDGDDGDLDGGKGGGNLWAYLLDEDENMSGVLLQIAFFLLILTSIGVIRRLLFQLFYYSHLLLFAAVTVTAILHGAGATSAGCAYMIADIVLRYGYLSYRCYPHTATVTRLPANVIKVSFPKTSAAGKTFNYSGGQYIFIMIPQLSVFEWHPFSISSAPYQDTVSVHIRVLGDWTQRLHDLAASESKEMKVYIEGPVGAPSLDLDSDRYKCVFLLSGGIGITPMQSICNELMHAHEVDGKELKKVCFVWAVRDRELAQGMKEEGMPLGFSGGEAEGSSRFVPDLVRKSKSRAFSQISPELDAEVEDGDDGVLHTEYYLTRGGDGVREYNGLELICRRPDVKGLMAKMARYAKAKGENRVGVLVCGPDMMVKAAREAAALLSGTNGVHFDFHSETFNF